jgi:hypothetical protein
MSVQPTSVFRIHGRLRPDLPSGSDPGARTSTRANFGRPLRGPEIPSCFGNGHRTSAQDALRTIRRRRFLKTARPTNRTPPYRYQTTFYRGDGRQELLNARRRPNLILAGHRIERHTRIAEQLRGEASTAPGCVAALRTGALRAPCRDAVTLSPKERQRWYRDGMRRIGLLILYVVATAIALGGVGDLTIRALFEVHKRFLGTADVPAATTSLILHLLHALGGGLVGIGIASFALVHFAVRRGERWALWTMLAAVVASEGANALGMYAVGSFWYVSVTYIVLTAIGVTLLVAAKSKA